MKKLDVIVAGDVNLDIIPEGLSSLPNMGEEKFVKEMAIAVGGSAANTAISLAKLGARVGIYGVISKDKFSEYILAYLKEAGVETFLLDETEDVGTGVSIGLTSGKDRCFISYMGNNETYNPRGLLEKEIEIAKHIHVAGFNWGNLIEDYLYVSSVVKKRGLTLSLDIGFDYYEKYQEQIYQILKYVDVFFPNEVEALRLTECENTIEAVNKLSNYVKLAIVTRGNKGVIAREKDKVWDQPPFSVKAVDAVGAGDAFDAGFLYGYLNSLTLPECLVLGSACGAIAVSNYGGGTSSPTGKELRDFIKERGYSEINLNGLEVG